MAAVAAGYECQDGNGDAQCFSHERIDTVTDSSRGDAAIIRAHHLKNDVRNALQRSALLTPYTFDELAFLFEALVKPRLHRRPPRCTDPNRCGSIPNVNVTYDLNTGRKTESPTFAHLTREQRDRVLGRVVICAAADGDDGD
jgi:hypothetical protein